jgi:hypothetical protein
MDSATAMAASVGVIIGVLDPAGKNLTVSEILSDCVFGTYVW